MKRHSAVITLIGLVISGLMFLSCTGGDTTNDTRNEQLPSTESSQIDDTDWLLIEPWKAAKANESANDIALIPRPSEMEIGNGVLNITSESGIAVSGGSAEEMLRLGELLSGMMNDAFDVAPEVSEGGNIPANGILLKLDSSRGDLGDEGYELVVSSEGLSATACSTAGIFYSIQTLNQLMSASDGAVSVPAVEITDIPEYEWRGMLLDCARHFHSLEYVKRYIDLLAYHKMNVFHWHLTEDQGWRLEIKKYPRLTEVGAWRDHFGTRYGGYYTQEEAREIVKYAQERYITVVPEIEMPGHSTAAVAAYNWLSCTQQPVYVEHDWGIFLDVYCPGKDSTFMFLEDVLDEVCEIFPSPYIHIGGDECPKYNWERCPDCKKRMEELGIDDVEELQGYLTKRIDKYMRDKGRNIIGWDEVLEGGVAQTAVVQSWRGMEGAVEGARHGNKIISSPIDFVYYNAPQSNQETSKATENMTISLEKTYSFDPVPDELTPEQQALIMGAECCLWCEFVFSFDIDPQMFPRLCAFSENMWAGHENADFDDFKERLAVHEKRLSALGVDYWRPEVKVGEWKPEQMGITMRQFAWDVTEHIDKAGVYRFNLTQDVSDDAVLISWAALFENNREIARYIHPYRAPLFHLFFLKYPLRVEKYDPDATYTLRVKMGRRYGEEASGTVWMRYFDDKGQTAIP